VSFGDILKSKTAIRAQKQGFAFKEKNNGEKTVHFGTAGIMIF